MGWRKTLAASAAVGLFGAGLVGAAYIVAPEETREAASELVALVQQSGGREKEAVVDAGEGVEGAAEGQGISEPTSRTGLPDWIQQTYIDGADLVYDDMFGGEGGPVRVRLYERDIYWGNDEGGQLNDCWLVLLADRPDGTQIFYQDWMRNGEMDAMAFTRNSETRFYEHDLVRVFKYGDEDVLRQAGIGAPLFEEGESQLEDYLSAIYESVGTYEERHPKPDPIHFQQEDLEILKGER